jgi:hypothetical protein
MNGRSRQGTRLYGSQYDDSNNFLQDVRLLFPPETYSSNFQTYVAAQFLKLGTIAKPVIYCTCRVFIYICVESYCTCKAVAGHELVGRSIFICFCTSEQSKFDTVRYGFHSPPIFEFLPLTLALQWFDLSLVLSVRKQHIDLVQVV